MRRPPALLRLLDEQWWRREHEPVPGVDEHQPWIIRETGIDRLSTQEPHFLEQVTGRSLVPLPVTAGNCVSPRVHRPGLEPVSYAASAERGQVHAGLRLPRERGHLCGFEPRLRPPDPSQATVPGFSRCAPRAQALPSVRGEGPRGCVSR